MLLEQSRERCTCCGFLADTGEQQETAGSGRVPGRRWGGWGWLVVFSICKLLQMPPSAMQNHCSVFPIHRGSLSKAQGGPPIFQHFVFASSQVSSDKWSLTDNTKGWDTSQTSGCSCLRVNRENRCTITVSWGRTQQQYVAHGNGHY